MLPCGYVVFECLRISSVIGLALIVNVFDYRHNTFVLYEDRTPLTINVIRYVWAGILHLSRERVTRQVQSE